MSRSIKLRSVVATRAMVGIRYAEALLLAGSLPDDGGSYFSHAECIIAGEARCRAKHGPSMTKNII